MSSEAGGEWNVFILVSVIEPVDEATSRTPNTYRTVRTDERSDAFHLVIWLIFVWDKYIFDEIRNRKFVMQSCL